VVLGGLAVFAAADWLLGAERLAELYELKIGLAAALAALWYLLGRESGRKFAVSLLLLGFAATVAVVAASAALVRDVVALRLLLVLVGIAAGTILPWGAGPQAFAAALAAVALVSTAGYLEGSRAAIDYPQIVAVTVLGVSVVVAAELERHGKLLRREQAALRRSERQHRSLVESVRAIVWRCEPETFRFTFVSPAAERILGWPVERWLSDPGFWVGHIHPEDRERVVGECREATRRLEPHEFDYRMMAADGRIVWLRDAIHVVVEDGQPRELIGVMVDVTPLKDAEAALRRSEEEFRTLAEGASDLISRHAADGTILYVSPACRTILGFEPQELVGRPNREFFHPEEAERVLGAVREAARTGAVRSETFRVRRKDGSYAWVESRFRALRENGRAVEFVAVTRDVTERVRLEEMRRDFVAMLSHDLKNPLGVILGFAELLREDPGDAEAVQELAARIEASAEEALGLVQDFLDTERIERGQFEIRRGPVSLESLIDRVCLQQAGIARLRHVRIERRCAPSLPELSADERLLERALGNLVRNALRFAPEGSTVLVEAEGQGEQVAVRVRDRGPGVPEAERSSLFRRFSAPGAKRDSTGLGLFVVKTIVEAHGGAVVAEFPPEGGSVFGFVLPLGEGEEARATKAEGLRSGAR
jgi:PAS domain S-box-containing protein